MSTDTSRIIYRIKAAATCHSASNFERLQKTVKVRTLIVNGKLPLLVSQRGQQRKHLLLEYSSYWIAFFKGKFYQI